MSMSAPGDLRTRRGIVGTTGATLSPGQGYGYPSSSSSSSSPYPSVQGYGYDYGSSGEGRQSSSYSQQGWQSAPITTNRSSASSSSSERLSRELIGTFLLILVTACILHADQNLAAPNLSAIASDFEMTPMQKDTRLGGMVQFGFFLIGGAVSLLVGPATDQIDRVTLLSVVVLSGAIPSLLMSYFVPSTKAGFFYFFLARICTGIAIGGSFPVLFSLSADLFPASQRTFVATSISAATNVGAAVGGMMSGILGPKYGWRVPFRFVGIPALTCAILVRVLLEDPRTVKQRKKAMEDASSNRAFTAWSGGQDVAAASGYVRLDELDFLKFRKILDVRTNMLIFAQALPGCIPISCITTFLADYLAVEQGMMVQASTAVTAVFGVSCLCFAVTGGMIGQEIYNKRKDNLPLLIGTTSCLAPLPFIMLVNSPQSAVTSALQRPTMFALFLALCGGCAATTGPNVRAILMNVNDSEVRGTVFSAFTLFDDLGKGMGPSMIVAMTVVLGRRTAYTLAFCFWWISGAILFMVRKSLPADAAKSGGSLLPMKHK